MSINERQDQIIEEFSHFDSWEDRYKKIIEIGRSLPELDEVSKIEKNKVKGCQSQVWLLSELTQDGKVKLTADSDAIIAKGLIALLIRLYSDSTPDEILATAPSFVEVLGFKNNLSPSRANGLFSMIKQIKMFATAYQLLRK